MTNLVQASLPLGIFFHAVGATFAATCYTPQKKVKGWSWEIYWITQASLCWFLLPILGAMATIPHLLQVLAEAPRDAMIRSFLLGAAYGIGGTAFGLSIRHIGFSLTYAIAVGLSSVLGTLIPPLYHHTLVASLTKPGGDWVLTGVIVGAVGIGLCGLAGRQKELDLQHQSAAPEFHLLKGLLLSLLAGVLSAVYGFALDAGKPIEEIAVKYGAGVWQGNVTYIFSNSGAFLTTAIYCIYLGIKHHTFGELFRASDVPDGGPRPRLSLNYVLAVTTGLFWYGQFFFYNLGHVHLGNYKFTSWAIHMIMLVLISNVVGIVLKEWLACRPRTRLGLNVALSILVAAVLLLTYGNYLGNPN